MDVMKVNLTLKNEIFGCILSLHILRVRDKINYNFKLLQREDILLVKINSECLEPASCTNKKSNEKKQFD